MSSENMTEEPTSQPSDEELRQQLIAELEELAERLRSGTPGEEPAALVRRRLMSLVEETLSRFPLDIPVDGLERAGSALAKDALDPRVWKRVWNLIGHTLQYSTDLVMRRFSGEYYTDEWGLDWEFVDAVRPIFTFLYEHYWRVTTTGLENIPAEGRALLVANHSGQLPWDGAMVGTAILNEHPAHRLVRTLYSDWFPRVPFISIWLARMGQTLASVENGTRLLGQDELVAVYPEGYKGIGKLYKDRYRLARFGRGGFTKMALATQAPIIPVSVVGAEETYISLAHSRLGAKITGLPYVPITPTFPWLGPLGFLPLPTKWYIDFGEPIRTDSYDAHAVNNMQLVSQLSNQVRNTVQEMIYSRLAQRRSVLFG